jgi:SAM-dependent methyltransferase
MEPGPDELQRLYRQRFTDAERADRKRIWQVLVESYFQRHVPSTAAVLDLGSGYGEFLNPLRCAKRAGVDLNPESAKHLEPGIEFHSGDVRNLPMFPDGTFDVVFTSNLMEHLPSKDDVEKMIREARRILKPGGQFIAMGPNLRFTGGEYWDFWDHLTPITDRSLAEILNLLDFNILEQRPQFLPYTTRSALPRSSWLIRLYLHLPIAWPFFGGQFLLRAAKP